MRTRATPLQIRLPFAASSNLRVGVDSRATSGASSHYLHHRYCNALAMGQFLFQSTCPNGRTWRDVPVAASTAFGTTPAVQSLGFCRGRKAMPVTLMFQVTSILVVMENADALVKLRVP